MILICSTQVRVSTANFCEVVNVIMMSWGHWCEMLTLFWPFEKSGLNPIHLVYSKRLQEERKPHLHSANFAPSDHELVSFNRLGHSWPSHLWMWIMEISCLYLLLFTLVFFSLFSFTLVYQNRYSLRYLNRMWIMEISCLCLLLFTFVLFCLLLFTLVYKEKSVFLWYLKRMWIMEISCLCLPLFTFICTKTRYSFVLKSWVNANYGN